MRNSSLLKWPNKNNKGNKNNNKEEKKWLHAPETLLAGHVVYLVKFLGSTKVDKHQGIDVVKQGIQKLKFNQQLKKSEGDKTKTPKVELTISVDGVSIQEPKTKKMLHQYPLHKISYCADDKAEKRFFSFIAKDTANGGTNEHTCFVFVSDKLAEEIKLTIGQAFELAYQKFLDTSGKEMETTKQILVLQKRVALLENENGELKRRLKDVANIKGQADVQSYMHSNNITDLCEVPLPESYKSNSSNGSVTDGGAAKMPASSSLPTMSAAAKKESTASSSSAAAVNELICLESDVGSSGGNKLDGFSLDDINDDDFNPRASDDDEEEEEEAGFDPRGGGGDVSTPQQQQQTAPPPSIPPPALPPRVANNNSQNLTPAANIFENGKNDSSGSIFSSNPFNSSSSDPFGMSAFDSPSAPSSAGGIPVMPTKAESPFVAGLGGNAGQSLFADLDPLKK